MHLPYRVYSLMFTIIIVTFIYLVLDFENNTTPNFFLCLHVFTGFFLGSVYYSVGLKFCWPGGFSEIW